MDNESTPVEAEASASEQSAVEESTKGSATLAGGEVTTTDDAAEGNQEDTQSDTSAGDSEATASDDELEAWAKSQNLDLDKPEDARKLAKRFKDTQKALHTKTAEQSSLRAKLSETATVNIDELDPFEQRLQALENDLRRQSLETSVVRFYADNPDARALDTDMAAIVEQKPWLANDLETLYLVARSQKQDLAETAKEAGRKEVLSSVDAKQRASAPKASATTGASAKELTEEDVANMSLEEYSSRRDEILTKFGYK